MSAYELFLTVASGPGASDARITQPDKLCALARNAAFNVSRRVAARVKYR